MNTQTKALAAAAAALMLAILIAVAVKLWPNAAGGNTVSLPANGACDIQAGPCASPVPGGGRIELAIAPRPIPLLQPLQVLVRLDGLEAKAVEVDFAGVDMNMGVNRHALAPQGEGRYSGEAVLPICVTGRMAWQASVIVDGGKARIVAPFRFVTSRR